VGIAQDGDDLQKSRKAVGKRKADCVVSNTRSNHFSEEIIDQSL
jgi:hypothetical protein